VQALVTKRVTRIDHVKTSGRGGARGRVLVRTLEVGVAAPTARSPKACSDPAQGRPMLVLGHEALAVVERDG